MMGSLSIDRCVDEPARWVVRVVVALAVFVVVCVAGCERRSSGTPATGESHGDTSPTDGREASSQLRIVSLSPAVSAILRDLDLQERVVGRSSYEIALPRTLEICGDQAGIDFEALLRVHPTHIITQWGSRELPPRLKELARANHWTLHDVGLVRLDDIPRVTLELSAWLSPEDASRGAALADRMTKAWRRRDGLEGAGKILLLASVDPPTALGPGSFHHDLLVRLGGVPAMAEGLAYMRLDHEDLVRLAPDGIVLFSPRGPDEPARDSPTALESMGPLSRLDLPSIRSGRVAIESDPLCQTPSTALIDVGERLARTLESWRDARKGTPKPADAANTIRP
ncbi:MAG: hypothetical protein IPK69_10600 [Phycisphaerales bacterium]|nr:MAG: hypothetical protein IPK69_10600 [Phycisphaerales bacterium]